VVERGEHLRFALEARHAVGVVGEDVRQNFQRHVATQLGVAGAIDFAHTACADLGQNLISSDAGAW
jgi:hypothetical protein